jgi:hypothetical protein
LIANVRLISIISNKEKRHDKGEYQEEGDAGDPPPCIGVCKIKGHSQQPVALGNYPSPVIPVEIENPIPVIPWIIDHRVKFFVDQVNLFHSTRISIVLKVTIIIFSISGTI